MWVGWAWARCWGRSSSPALGSAPTTGPQGLFGKGEPRGTPAISLPNCLNSVALGSWNPDQMLVHVSQVASRAPIP